MRRLAFLAAFLAAAGCAMAPAPDAGRARQPAIAVPPALAFAPARPAPPRRSNAEMAQDFMDLSFQMESGRRLPVMTRFEEPVRVRVTGRMPSSAGRDLSILLARLRAEAGIDIALAGGGAPANVTIEFLPQRTMQAVVPQAACFVAPRISAWSEYRRARRGGATDWTTLTLREQVAIFVPNDVAPQEIRDCLHEELAQALGPLNDLFRLPDSVFNDDNIHSILTGFDMLMLRAYYAPELASGMGPEEVAARLPAVMRRLNPGGGGVGGVAVRPDDTPRAYVQSIEAALGARGSPAARLNAARNAITIAEEAGWQDNRAGFAWFVYGRLALSRNPNEAVGAFLRSAAIYRSNAGLGLHAAHPELQLAAFALSQGAARDVLLLTDRAGREARGAQNAALLSTLLLIRAEALDLDGAASAANAARQEALGWAQYGFGSAEEAVRRLQDIALISPGRTAALTGVVP
jgi:hypothetical protein